MNISPNKSPIIAALPITLAMSSLASDFKASIITLKESITFIIALEDLDSFDGSIMDSRAIDPAIDPITATRASRGKVFLASPLLANIRLPNTRPILLMALIACSKELSSMVPILIILSAIIFTASPNAAIDNAFPIDALLPIELMAITAIASSAIILPNILSPSFASDHRMSIILVNTPTRVFTANAIANIVAALPILLRPSPMEFPTLLKAAASPS